MRELVQTAESFTREFKFDYSTIIWKEDGHFFRSTLPERILLRKSVDIDNLSISEPIPIHLIRGLWHDGLTEASNPPSDYFVKVLDLLSYDTLPLGEITAAEADICEILKRNPHKNICVYYGCTRGGEYIGGLCFKRYQRNLYHEMETGGPLDRRAVIDGITEGVTFLHSLGLIHNDLGPGNSMLEADGTPVIIDFDSCRRDGEPMGIKKGTPGWSAGWTKKPSSIARKANDFYSLKLLEDYLNGEYQGHDKFGEIHDGLVTPPPGVDDGLLTSEALRPSKFVFEDGIPNQTSTIISQAL